MSYGPSQGLQKGISNIKTVVYRYRRTIFFLKNNIFWLCFLKKEVAKEMYLKSSHNGN